MDPIQPLIITIPRPRHPLADVHRPVPVLVVLIGVLAVLGWSAEQVIAVLAVALPTGIAASREPSR